MVAARRGAAKRKADALDEFTSATNGVAPTVPEEAVEKATAKAVTVSRKVTRTDTRTETEKKTKTTATTTAAAKPKTATATAKPKKAAAAPRKVANPKTTAAPRTTPPQSVRESSNLEEKTASQRQKTPEIVEPPAKKARPSPKSKSPAKPKAAAPKAVVPKAVAPKAAAPKAVAPKAPPKAKPAKLVPILTTAPTDRLNVFACGTGEYGELGLGPSPKAKTVGRPRLNALLPIDSVGVVAVAYGGMHGVALTHDGKVYTWGVNDLGALGRITKAKDEKLKDADADSSDSDDEDEVPLNEDESTPKPVDFPEGTIITRIAAGDSLSLAVTNAGRVYGWGTFRVSPFIPGALSFPLHVDIFRSPMMVFWASPNQSVSSRRPCSSITSRTSLLSFAAMTMLSLSTSRARLGRGVMGNRTNLVVASSNVPV